MRVVKMKLIKRGCADGLCELKETTPLGRLYDVDLDSRRVERIKNLPTGIEYDLTVIDIIEDGRCAGWFPADLLEPVEGARP